MGRFQAAALQMIALEMRVMALKELGRAKKRYAEKTHRRGSSGISTERRRKPFGFPSDGALI
jgi:hypothetical protein